MKTGAAVKHDKMKWLTALCLCVLCFTFCLTMLARPTYADEPGFLDELDRIGVLRWDDSNGGEHKDSLGEKQGMAYSVGHSFNEAGTLCWVRYRLGGKFTIFTGKLACAESSTADAAMRLKVYVDNKSEPVFVSEPIRRDTPAFGFKVDVIGANEMRLELEQTGAPAAGRPEGQESKAYALLIAPQLVRARPGSGYKVPLKDIALLPDSTWKTISFASNKDAKGNTLSNSAKLGGTLGADGTMGLMGQARYQLDKKYYVIYGLLACAEDSAADAVMQVKFYADTTAAPIYTSPLIKRGTGLVQFVVDVSDVSVLKIELTGTTDPKAAQAPLSGWILLESPFAEPVAAPAPTTTSAPSTSEPKPVITYRPVEGWVNLYKKYVSADPQGLPGQNDPFTLVYSFSGKPETDSTPVHVYKEKYYFEVLEKNVYLELKKDGLFNASDAIWAGADGKFDTVDDRIAVLRAGSYFYEEKPGEWKFLVSRFDYADSRWAGRVDMTTTTAPSTGSTGSIETTTNDFLNANGNHMPKTGVPFSAGLLVCAAVLLMGCAYCAWRLTRKQKA